MKLAGLMVLNHGQLLRDGVIPASRLLWRQRGKTIKCRGKDLCFGEIYCFDKFAIFLRVRYIFKGDNIGELYPLFTDRLVSVLVITRLRNFKEEKQTPSMEPNIKASGIGKSLK